MQHLNLPAYPCKLKHSPEQTLIFDIIRRKYVVLTPEEWVRQHFIHYLITHLNYPKSLIAVERGTRYIQLAKRTDVCVYGRDGRPLLLAECKSPDVPISAETVKQAVVYNKSLQAPYIVLTNGLQHYCWEVNTAEVTTKPLSQIPAYPDINMNG